MKVMTNSELYKKCEECKSLGGHSWTCSRRLKGQAVSGSLKAGYDVDCTHVSE